MANQKLDVITIGKGANNSNATSSRIFTSSMTMSAWSVSTSYIIDGCAEYGGHIYRSLTNANLNNQPDISPNDWEIILKNTQNGDVCHVSDITNADIQMRQLGTWISVYRVPQTVNLVDGQLTYVPAMSYSAADYPVAFIEYSIKRGSGARREQGLISILSDGSSVQYATGPYNTIGSSINVTLSVSIALGIISITYISVNEGSAIEFKYSLRGWQ